MEHIIVATDGSEHADRAVALASDLAAKYAAELVILHVIPERPLSTAERHLAEIEFAREIEKYPGSGLPDAVPNVGEGELEMASVVRAHEKRDRALRSMIGETVLKRAEHAARAKGVEQVDAVLAEGAAAAKILEAAKVRTADMIVLGSRGLGAVGELFLGSVSHKVTHLADVTVVTVK